MKEFFFTTILQLQMHLWTATCSFDSETFETSYFVKKKHGLWTIHQVIFSTLSPFDSFCGHQPKMFARQNLSNRSFEV